jgi:hypothetical protein
MKGDIPLGYYCPVCLCIQNIKREYLVPVDLITRMDPFYKTVSKREAYLAVVKTKDLSIPPPPITNDKITVARETLSAAFHPFCREPGLREGPRLDREKFLKDLHADGDKNQVGKNEINTSKI